LFLAERRRNFTNRGISNLEKLRVLRIIGKTTTITGYAFEKLIHMERILIDRNQAKIDIPLTFFGNKPMHLWNIFKPISVFSSNSEY
jgi:hypothetical protein